MTNKLPCIWYKKDPGFITLMVYVQPGAKHNEIAGFHGNELKIRLKSPPIDGRANEALKKYMSLIFEVPLRQVELKKGDKSRHKTVVVMNSKIEPETIENVYSLTHHRER